ncbi:unnamed protein product [Taenia asiatica]|uniref:DED domain-containing protein n=1 Tax=Taenia asiatica TaxID=60517 RepID=A0A0R3VZ74_TAEAS|nr:unnamed protein product [Taenia asiatica]
MTQSGAVLKHNADRHSMGELFVLSFFNSFHLALLSCLYLSCGAFEFQSPISKRGVRCCKCFSVRFLIFRCPLRDVCYSADFANLKPSFLETLAQKLENFETFSDGEEELTGEKVNRLSRLSLCELLIELIKLEPTCLKNHPKLQAYLSCFEEIK